MHFQNRIQYKHLQSSKIKEIYLTPQKTLISCSQVVVFVKKLMVNM